VTLVKCTRSVLYLTHLFWTLQITILPVLNGSVARAFGNVITYSDTSNLYEKCIILVK